eukprot:scaffold45607_cov237-Amphora_coffeaeformis.AAC.3
MTLLLCVVGLPTLDTIERVSPPDIPSTQYGCEYSHSTGIEVHSRECEGIHVTGPTFLHDVFVAMEVTIEESSVLI